MPDLKFVFEAVGAGVLAVCALFVLYARIGAAVRRK